MKVKIGFIFFLTILIPTFFLAYFGLLAVRSEKSIVEKNLQQKYKAMAEIVHSEIQTELKFSSFENLFKNNEERLRKLLIEQASLFSDDIRILDKDEKVIGGQEILDYPVFFRLVKGLPYKIAVYERYPLIFTQLEEKNRQIYMYIAIIIFSAISILGGASYTLCSLAKEWWQAKLKSAFVAQLSHDIRKPLTSIRMFAEMLEEGHLPSEEKRKEYYKIISDESNKLTDLANSILDFSRIESGKVRYEFQKIEIDKMLEDIVARFKQQEPEREVILTKEDKLFFAEIDEPVISQAVMNLLSNAHKYSPLDKSIKVAVTKKGTGNFFEIEVIDQGIGISQSEQKKIFQKYYRVFKKTGELQGIEGTGLGLTLVKYAMEAHKGKVLVESQEGKGSKFSLCLKSS